MGKKRFNVHDDLANMAWFPHAGGFAAGLFLVIIMKKGRRRS
jgi:membrane associated rhomboid family serine protease